MAAVSGAGLSIDGFPAIGDDGLTQIVVRVLLGITVGCVEFSGSVVYLF